MNNSDTGFEIRKAELSHAADIIRIEKASFSAPWSDASILSAIEDDVVKCICLLKDGAVAGYAMYAFVCDEGELLNIAVDPEFRGLGLGSILLSKVIESGKESGAETIFLEVRESNISAIGLYTRENFEIYGKRKNYYTSPREDAVLMKKRLQ